MIAILDFGSQYSELIARRIREANVFSEVVPFHTPLEELKKKKNLKGIILSGGPSSVYDEKAPQLDPNILNGEFPVLGICYGMQLIAKHMGGKVSKSKSREYGKASLYIDNNHDLFEGLWLEMQIWMSHGDSVSELPEGFIQLGHTSTCEYAAIGNPLKKIFGIQFHPEVSHTPRGSEIIRNFLFQVCDCTSDWTPKSFVDEAIELIQKEVGDKHVLCALSGGVDSSVVAALMQKAIGSQLTCMFIDQGFMRKNEGQRIKELFGGDYKINLISVNAAEEFYKRTDGITDPEEKRKAIGEEFIRVFEKEAKKLANKITFLAQGTLYPDIIESASVGVAETAVKIKTHHNVGGLPEKMDFKIIEPLKKLFKDEVRRVGLELGMPEEMVFRQPFPGPGLAIRIIGELSKKNVKILQEADAIVMDVIKKAGLYRELWQAFAVLLPTVKTVGVQGDQRTYQYTVAIRAVTSEDAMTAHWAHLPYEVLEDISSRIINEIAEINRVVYDISSKPPATIEWE